MKNRRNSSKNLTAVAILAGCLAGGSQAAELFVDSSVLDQAMSVVAEKYSESVVAQEEINRLANSASSDFEEFKRENDNLEALLVVNAGFRKQIAAQNEDIAELDTSIANVEVVTREIPLLMEKMLASIEQFISLDYPFRLEERMNMLQFARDAIDNPNVSIAERFRQVLVMYQTESAYGRFYETYPDTIELNGTDRDVMMVQIGRIALMYQTTDRQEAGAWDNNARQWVTLDPLEYRAQVQTAIRVVDGLDAPKIIELPIIAPETVQ